jgi:transposase-like protein
MGRRGYPAEVRGQVLDLVAVGGPVARIAAELGISDQTIYTWARQEKHRPGSGTAPEHRGEDRAGRGQTADPPARDRVGGHLPGHGADPGGSTPKSPLRRRDDHGG